MPMMFRDAVDAHVARLGPDGEERRLPPRFGITPTPDELPPAAVRHLLRAQWLFKRAAEIEGSWHAVCAQASLSFASGWSFQHRADRLRGIARKQCRKAYAAVDAERGRRQQDAEA